MWSRKYVVPEICQPGDNMSAICRPKFFFSGALPPNPRAGGSAPLHPPRGGLAPPPLTPLHAQRRCSDTTTRAKNITHTQPSWQTCCCHSTTMSASNISYSPPDCLLTAVHLAIIIIELQFSISSFSSGSLCLQYIDKIKL
jgi:hypothetical protein